MFKAQFWYHIFNMKFKSLSKKQKFKLEEVLELVSEVVSFPPDLPVWRLALIG